MIGPTARLEIAGSPPRTMRQKAAVPQRWTTRQTAGDGWIEVTHQLLGDGVFGGDTHRTSIRAAPGTRAVVRSVAATPLRGPAPSATITHLHVAAGASLLYLPGALIPQRGSDHASILRLSVGAGGNVIAVSVVVPGRSAMGERGDFSRIRLKTVARSGHVLTFGEDAALSPARTPIDGIALFAGQGAMLSALAVGDGPAGDPSWWAPIAAIDGLTGGADELRSGGSCFRALCDNLGVAQAAARMIESRIRSS